MNIKNSGVGGSNYADQFSIDMEMETLHVDSELILIEYRDAIHSFEQNFSLIEYPDSDADTITIVMIQNLSPMVSERWSITDSIVSSIKPLDCIDGPDQCKQQLETELNNVFSTDDCLLQSSIVQILEIPPDVIVQPNFQLKTTVRTKASDLQVEKEQRIYELYQQKFLHCAENECVNTSVYDLTVLEHHYCELEICNISRIPELIPQVYNTSDVRVVFSVEIFTDKSSASDVIDMYLLGVNNDDNYMYLYFDQNDFDNHTVTARNSDIEDLKKYTSIGRIPTTETISDENVHLFHAELTILVCGESDFNYCYVQDGLTVTTLNVIQFKFTIYSTETEDDVKRKVENNIHHPVDTIVLFDQNDLIDVSIELTEHYPVDYDVKFSAAEVIMISTFSAIGFLIPAGFLIFSFTVLEKLTISDIIVFILVMVAATVLSVTIYYAVIGDIEWSSAGITIGATVAVLFIIIAIRNICTR